MLDFSDAPYQFFPAKPSPFIISLARWGNRKFSLPGSENQVAEIKVTGEIEKLEEHKKRESSRLLYIANHPTHGDPYVMLEVQRQLGVKSCFMAAYDVFLRSKLKAWVMQRVGAFSIDRETSDRKAISMAGDILQAGDYGLTIFPEGNVHLTNDLVTPFLEGASFIASRTQKSLGTDANVIAIPISLKYSYIEDIRPKVQESIDHLAAAVKDTYDRNASVTEELMRIGSKLLVRNLAQRGYLTKEEQQETLESDSLSQTLLDSAERIVSGLEPKMDISPKSSDSIQDRVKRIRSNIHKILSDPEKEIDHRSAQGWADEALLVIRILGYVTPYIRDNPSLDRIAETVEKLNEDLHNRIFFPEGNRSVIAHIGSPINVAKLLAEHAKPREAMSALTTTLETTIQSGVGHINNTLATEGSKPF